MTDFEEYEKKLQAEQMKKLSGEEQHEAYLASLPDWKFEIETAKEIRKAELEAERNPQAPKPQPGVVQDDGSLDHLNDGEFGEMLMAYGINAGTSFGTLSDALSRGERERQSKQYDEVMGEHRRRGR